MNPEQFKEAYFNTPEYEIFQKLNFIIYSNMVAYDNGMKMIGEELNDLINQMRSSY